MSKTIIHPNHCCCLRCAPRHPTEQHYPLPVRAALLAAMTVAAWALVFWAAVELRDLLCTWSSI